MLKLEEKTPMRVTVRVQADSQEKKRQLHLKQGNKTIQDQEKSMKLQGATTPSAVVIVKVDYCTIRGAIEIVGIIYKIANGGGARIATVKQILSNRPRRGHWWIPADQYVVKFGAKELAVVSSNGQQQQQHNKRNKFPLHLTGAWAKYFLPQQMPAVTKPPPVKSSWH